MKSAAVMFLVAGSAVLLAQAPVSMMQEPHHKLLTYQRNMRVFEVTVPPGQMTLDHGHDHDTATIVLGPAMTRTRIMGQDWTAPRDRALGATEFNMYTGAPIVHRLENVGPTTYRIFTVENMRDGGWTALMPLQAPGTTLLQESRSLAIYDIKLGSGAPMTMHVHPNPSFVALLSGTVMVQGGGGETPFNMDGLGRWFPSVGADQPHTITAVGGDAHLIDVEVK